MDIVVDYIIADIVAVADIVDIAVVVAVILAMQ